MVILGYDCWQRRFNGDPNIVGKPMRMSRRDTPPTIIGVMPPGVRFLPSPNAAAEPNYNIHATVDYWMPGSPNPERLRQSRWDLIARLKPGVAIERAQAELTMLTAAVSSGDKDLEAFTPRVQPLISEMNRDGSRILWPLFGAATLVLLIACGNTAALLLVRGLQRRHEYAVRSALGSGRAALFRQASIESLVVALAGGTAGIALAVAIVRLFKAIGGRAIPRLDAVTTGWPLLLFGFAAALVAALAAGLVPALRAARRDPIDALRTVGTRASAGRGERRLLQLVTMAQTALTLALLIGAGLLVRTLQNVANVKSGYAMDRILTMTVTSVQGDWADFHHRALERVVAVPGVQKAAFVWGTPLTGNDWPSSLEIEDHPVTTPRDRVSQSMRSVTPGYFDLMGVPILEGRDFRDSDTQKEPRVAIVNQAFADKYFPGSRPIGKHLWRGPRDQPADEIVGVVGNARTADLTRAPQPEVYLSLWQSSAFSKDLVVRTVADPRAVIAAVRGGAARRQSHGVGRKGPDARRDPHRFHRVAHFRQPASRRLLHRRHLADVVRRLRRARAVGGVAAAGDCDSQRDWRAQKRHPQPRRRRRLPARRRRHRCGHRRRARRRARAAVVPVRGGADRPDRDWRGGAGVRRRDAGRLLGAV